MNILDIKSYFTFLSRNKLYTAVNIIGFSISLAFVFLLGTYIIREFTFDNFHEKKDRIYLLATNPDEAGLANPAGDFVMQRCPEVENYVRLSFERPVVEYNGIKTVCNTLIADTSFFNVFSFELIEGDPSKVLASANNIVITESTANKLFGNENPVGKSILMNDTSLIITGIAKDFPENTQFPKSDFIVNYYMVNNFYGQGTLDTWNNSSFTTYFLIKNGADIKSKEEFLLEEFKKEYWLYEKEYATMVNFIPLQDVYFSDIKFYSSEIKTNNKSIIRMYFPLTLLILIVAILNYINLSIAQVSSRGKEAAIKKLLGNSKRKIISQFITESVIMTLFAGIIGMFISLAIEPVFNNLFNVRLELLNQFTFVNILIIFIGIFLIGIVSGLFPALVVSKYEPIEVVKGTYSLKVKTVFSKILITFQYIVAISLLICGIFLIRQTNYLKNYNLGFDRDKLFIIDNILFDKDLSGLKNELLRIPSVENVSFTFATPLDGGNNNTFEYEGEKVSLQIFEVDSAFFDIYGIELFPFENVEPGSVWLNQKAMNVLHIDSVNRTFKNFNGEFFISGKTNDFNFKSLHIPMGPAMVKYMDEVKYIRKISVKIAASADAFETADRIRKVYSEFVDGELFESQFADDIIQEQYEEESKISKIIIAFSILTLVILMMGILAMSLYYVRQKDKEIAIRKVNGAREMNIMRMLNFNFVRLIAFASIIAIPLSYFIMRKWLQGYAYKIDLSWWIFILSVIVIILLSVIFVTLQSYKSATKNPIKSLNKE